MVGGDTEDTERRREGTEAEGWEVGWAILARGRALSAWRELDDSVYGLESRPIDHV